MKVEDIRREYLSEPLSEDNLNNDPFVQFDSWLKQAITAELKDPTAMSVATVDEHGQPSQRIVLLKHVDAEGFVFYTNLESRKAQEIKGNNKVSLHFPWHNMERQVIVYGTAEQLSTAQVMKYFMSRPKESQIAAWASKQSHPINSRQLLMQQFTRMKQKFSEGEVPLPSFWGGFRVKPHQIEFWQGGEHRIHDRFMYRRDDADNWHIERLMP